LIACLSTKKNPSAFFKKFQGTIQSPERQLAKISSFLETEAGLYVLCQFYLDLTYHEKIKQKIY